MEKYIGEGGGHQVKRTYKGQKAKKCLLLMVLEDSMRVAETQNSFRVNIQ